MFSSPLWQETLLGRKTAKEFWAAIGRELGLKTREKIEEFRRRYHADESINRALLNLIRQLHGRYQLAVLSKFYSRTARPLLSLVRPRYHNMMISPDGQFALPPIRLI
jgi:FMN phosphatase YigB (HAD superfamily)